MCWSKLLGVLNTNDDIRMDATFAPTLPIKGNVAFVSQSGALGGGILNLLKDLNFRFRSICFCW